MSHLLLLLDSPVQAAVPGRVVAGEAWLPLGQDWDRVAGVTTTPERRLGQVRVLLSAEAYEALLRQGVPVRGYRADHRLGAPPEGYHDPETASAVLASAVQRSSRAGLVQMGTSLEGRPIEAAWFGVPPGQGAPALRVLGGHHGDEPIAVEVALALACELADRDGEDEALTEMLDRSTVWVAPLVNPDGLLEGARTNSADVDLNRNYDYEWDGATSRAGQAPFSEPETRAVRSHALLERTLLSLSLHAGASNLGWPWNFTEAPPEDAQLFQLLAQHYAAHCSAPEFWVTQGAAWYVTYGDTNDWAYGRSGTLDFTLEVSLDKQPPSEQIDEIVSQHMDAMRRMLLVPPSLSGQVLDAITMAPVSATVWLDVPGAPTLTDPLTGSFHRLLPAGVVPQRLFAEAPGYAPGELALSEGEATLYLERTTLERPPELPRLLPPGASLLAQEQEITLWQPGAEPVVLPPGGSLDPRALLPGSWTLSVDGGPVWANVLLVESAERVEIESWTLQGEIFGAGFGAGTRVVGYWGETRHPVEIPVLSVADELLQIDPSALPEDEQVDLLVLSAGAILGIEDWARQDAAGGEQPRGACACRTPTGHLWGPAWSYVGWAWSLALIRRRRW
jgi:hypothetical protein